ncbi:hypothetical protein MJG53_017294 [Ovis ammon polii x Ovis aries]|nr:hypothetical protein JEQ12_010376 [Ovis aries]KAI4560665.1 hypothetical protein MJG53_017294 [Ovis ammon polii x Ovis aries]
MLRWTVHLEGGPRRVNHAAVAVGHRVYSFGGYCSGEDYETLRQIDVHIFNAVSLRWTKLPPVRPAARGQAPVVPYMRYGHSTVLIDDTVFLWGGRNDTEGACNVLYAFDVNTHKWSTPRVSGTVPGARDGHSACVLGKTMYIFGGYEQLADCFSNDIHKLDTSTMTWTLICTKGNPARWRDFHSATMLGSHMYVFGGRADRFGPFHSNNEIYCNRIRVFDTRTEAWLDCPPTPVLPEGRRSHSAFGYNGELYIFGGYNARLNRHFHDLWKFNPVSFTWKKIEPKGKGPCPRRRQCCCIVGDKIVLFGGTSPSPEEGLGDEFDLIDHSDLHILDFSPSLKTLCKLAVIQYNLDQSCLPHDIRWELNAMTTNSNISRPIVSSHGPLEMSAKVRVPFLRQVVPISKKVARDPRFDDLSGEYNPEVFDKTYQFLDDIRAREKELVKKQLKKRRSGEEHEKLQHLLQRMEQQEMAQKERKRQQELRLALKQERRAQAQQGHRPYFLKKSEQRQLVLAEKFKELKRSKKLESFLSRKRRRNAGKDRRHLPLSKE